MLKYKNYKNMVTIVLVLIFFLILICRVSSAFLNEQESKVLEAIKMKSPEQTQSQDVLDKDERPHLEYNAYSLRDPFIDPLVQQADKALPDPVEVDFEITPPALAVQGLIWGGRIPQAIINGKVVTKGDVIEGAEIIDIDGNGVVVIYNKKIFKLSSPASIYLDTQAKEVVK